MMDNQWWAHTNWVYNEFVSDVVINWSYAPYNLLPLLKCHNPDPFGLLFWNCP